MHDIPITVDRWRIRAQIKTEKDDDGTEIIEIQKLYSEKTGKDVTFLLKIKRPQIMQEISDGLSFL